MDLKSFGKGIITTLLIVGLIGLVQAWSDGQSMGQTELNSKDISTEYLDCSPAGTPYINDQEQTLVQEVYCMDIQAEGDTYKIVKRTQKYAYSLTQLYDCLDVSDNPTCIQIVKNSWIQDNELFKEEIRAKALEWQTNEKTINPTEFVLTSQELN